MANYNPDHPKERGFWYDVTVTRKVIFNKLSFCFPVKCFISQMGK